MSQTLIDIYWPFFLQSSGQSWSSSLSDNPALLDLTWLSLHQLNVFIFILASMTALSWQSSRAPSWPPSSRPPCRVYLFIFHPLCLVMPLLISLSRRHLLRQSSSHPPPMNWGHLCWGLRSFRPNCRSRWRSGTCKGARPERGGWDEDRGDRAGGVRVAQDKR